MKILKTTQRWICLGIVDIKEEKDNRWCDSKNAVYYWSKSGRIVYGTGNGDFAYKSQGQGFNIEDIVTLEVDLEK